MDNHLNYTGVVCPPVATHLRSTIVHYQESNRDGMAASERLATSKRRSEGLVFSALFGWFVKHLGI